MMRCALQQRAGRAVHYGRRAGGRQVLTKHFEDISSRRRAKLQRLSLHTERGHSPEHTRGHLQPTKITVLISH